MSNPSRLLRFGWFCGSYGPTMCSMAGWALFGGIGVAVVLHLLFGIDLTVGHNKSISKFWAFFVIAGYAGGITLFVLKQFISNVEHWRIEFTGDPKGAMMNKPSEGLAKYIAELVWGSDRKQKPLTAMLNFAVSTSYWVLGALIAAFVVLTLVGGDEPSELTNAIRSGVFYTFLVGCGITVVLSLLSRNKLPAITIVGSAVGLTFFLMLAKWSSGGYEDCQLTTNDAFGVRHQLGIDSEDIAGVWEDKESTIGPYGRTIVAMKDGSKYRVTNSVQHVLAKCEVNP